MIQTYQPLYLKYRPQTLAELVGQRAVAQTLANAIEYKRIAHAYLFTGPRGTGKTSSARIVAKSLNCQHGPTATPCLTCNSCEEVKLGISPSVFEIDAASNNSVDDARALIERAPLVAQGGRFKLYIIDECHMLTKEAFNALLKTIEEPPPNVIFILATTEEHKVPQTIVSRCQRLMFRLVSHKELIAHLKDVARHENIAIEDEALELIVRRSGGGLRDALGLLDQASLFASADTPVTVNDLLLLLGAIHEDVLLQMSEAVRSKDVHRVLSFVQELILEGREPAVLALELAKHFLSLTKASCLSQKQEDVALAQELIPGSTKYIESLLLQAPQFDRSELAQMVEQLDRLEQTCRRSSQSALNLEMGLVALCHRHDMVLVRELDKRISALEGELFDNGRKLNYAQSSENGKKAANTIAQNKVQAEAEREPVKKSMQDVGANTKVEIQIEPEAHDHKRLASNWVSDMAEMTEQPVEPITPINSEHKVAPSQPPDHSNIEALDQFWAALLDELQRRHLPTFSLVSTHAFPVSLVKSDLIIGVMVENFQKMIENKAEHIKAAGVLVAGQALSIKVKVANPDSTRARPKIGEKQLQKVETTQDNIDKSAGVTGGDLTDQSSFTNQSTVIAGVSSNTQSSDVSDSPSTLLNEAYNLFEGPGSRQI